MEQGSEAERRLGLEYVNIAAHGVKSHLGRRLSEDEALVLFDRPSTKETILARWSLKEGRAMTSETLPFGLGMLWHWDWRAELVEQAIERMETKNPAASAAP